MSVELRKPRILVVDDEVAMVRSLEFLLRSVGEVYKAYSVPEAEEFLSKNMDCIVTDVSMPEASGLTLVDKVKKTCPETPVIVMTAYSSVPEAVEAMQRGAFEYLTKPFENHDMLSCVRRAVEKKGVIIGETKNIPSGWVCNSEAMRLFVTKAEKLARSQSPVLLMGERGVGKKRAARWMFELVRSKKTNFVVVDSKMHEEDSPLMNTKFGKNHILYLSEIFSLEKRLQDRLMEIIADGKAKVIAGSSSSPSVQARDDFREDLREAFIPFALRIPSLKEREADLEALCYQIVESAKEKMRFKDLKLDAVALDVLRKRTFVGNVKELEQTLERAAVESRGGIITEKDLLPLQSDLSSQLPFSIPVEDGWKRLEFLMRGLEKELIERAVEKYPQTSNAQIASILGTTRRILELRMKTYRIREG